MGTRATAAVTVAIAFVILFAALVLLGIYHLDAPQARSAWLLSLAVTLMGLSAALLLLAGLPATLAHLSDKDATSDAHPQGSDSIRRSAPSQGSRSGRRSAQEHLERARTLFRGGHLDEAESELRASLRKAVEEPFRSARRADLATLLVTKVRRSAVGGASRREIKAALTEVRKLFPASPNIVQYFRSRLESSATGPTESSATARSAIACFECDPPPPDHGLCSDNECPCPQVRIPRGTGYLYIEPALVAFRRKYPRLADAQAAMEERVRRRFGCEVGGIVRVVPVLVCEQGARLRNLDLKTAHADARRWWETGQAPLRPTPLSDGSVPFVGEDDYTGRGIFFLWRPDWRRLTRR